MRFREDMTREYISRVPLALALERLAEAALYRDKPFESPVLDVGCGDGLFASICMAEVIDVGIDPNPRELDVARETGAYGQLIPCFGAAIPKEDSTFGTAISNSVLEHIPDIRAVMKEVLRVLKPGGNFYFTVPSDKFYSYSVLGSLLNSLGMPSMQRRYHKRYNRFWKHFHDYSLDEWKKMTRECGYEVVEAYTYNSAWSCRLNDSLVPLGGVGKVNKAITNQWVISPQLRQRTVGRLHKRVSRRVNAAGETQDGGLVFLWVRKPDASA